MSLSAWATSVWRHEVEIFSARLEARRILTVPLLLQVPSALLPNLGRAAAAFFQGKLPSDAIDLDAFEEVISAHVDRFEKLMVEEQARRLSRSGIEMDADMAPRLSASEKEVLAAFLKMSTASYFRRDLGEDLGVIEEWIDRREALAEGEED